MDASSPTGHLACNQSVIVGELVQPPELRDLPSGGSLVSFSLTVRAEGRKTTSVPLTWFNPPKRVFRWKEGELVVAVGSVMRRFYQAGGRTGSRTDVEVSRAESISQTKRAGAVIERAIGPLADVLAALPDG